MKVASRLFAPVFFLLLALVAFRAVWPADQVLQSTDFNVGVISIYKRIFPADWFHGSWTSSGLLGSAASRPFNLTNLVILLFPVTFVCDWAYAIHLVIASFAFTAFLRRTGVGLAAALFGSLTAFWLASNLTLAYPGHLYKYGVLSACALFLWLWEKALAGRRTGWFLLAGGAFGLMFLEQQDLAVFAAVLAGPYAAWRLWATRAEAPGTAARWSFLAAAVPALLLMSDAYFKARATFIDPGKAKGAEAAKDAAKAAADKWDWATQWSWPPAETIDFIAPGYHGLRSGEPGREYWGEMGRSPEWKETGRGFRNFKLESQYLGALPVGFALLAAALAFAPFARGAPARADLRFWTVATLLLFLLSCGKYLPLYRLFYALPQMDAIRNPNKFLQVFQLALGVLAARGFDSVLGQTRAACAPILAGKGRWVAWGAVGFAVLMLLAWMTAQTSAGSLAQRLGGQRYAEPDKLAAGATAALGWAFLMSALLAGVLWTALASKAAGSARLRQGLAGLALALVVLDVLRLADDYLVAQPLGAIRDNPVAEYLRKEAEGARVHAPDQSGLYGHLLTYVFPFAGVDYMNILAAPRMASEMGQYLAAVGQNLPRQWNHFGASHVLVPAQLWDRLRANPAFAALLEPVMGWGAVRDERSGFRMVEMREKPQHVVLRIRNAPGRCRLVGAWKEASPEEVVKALANPAADLERTAWVERVEGAPLPGSGEPGPAGKAAQTRGVNQVVVKVEAERPAMLVLADALAPGFHATLNGKDVPLRRVNHILMGVPVPAGSSEVVVRFAPPPGGARAVRAGLAACLGGALSLLPLRRRPS